MPRRIIPFANNEYYHVFNRGINKQPIFLDKRCYGRALEIMEYYSFANPFPRYSRLLCLSREERERTWTNLRKEGKRLVEIISFSFLPNHFHFLVKQVENNGVQKLLKEFQNSYTRFFNTKYKKIGPILQGQFKAVRIEDTEQLLHVSRYIHLNPHSSYVVKNIESLEDYFWSSYPEYVSKTDLEICKKKIILSQFKKIYEYKKFVDNNASYQRELEKIRHLTLEN